MAIQLPATPGSIPSDVIRHLSQYTRWRLKTPLSPDEYQWVSEQLAVTITTSATTGTLTFRAPANFTFLIFRVDGLLAFNLPASETLAVTNLGNLSVADRVLVKGMNSRIALSNSDRIQKFFNTADIPLSTILAPAGGQPLLYNPPHIVPDGEAIQLDVTSKSTESTIIGASTEVGVTLTGLRLRTRV